MIKTSWVDVNGPMWPEICRIREEVLLRETEMTGEIFAAEDERAAHILILDGSLPVACGKIAESGELCYVAVLPEHRGNGYGSFAARLLIRRAFDGGRELQYVYIPLGVKDFFAKLGFAFEAPGEEGYILMTRNGDIHGSCA